MSSQLIPDGRAIELSMIARDVVFFRELMAHVTATNEAGILMLGLIPYLSLFVIETYAYLSSEVPQLAEQLKRQHEDILRASRTRIKLFDDDRRDVAELLGFLRWISDLQTAWFIESHVGPLAWLKKLIQPDVGLFMYGNRLISTTQVAFFNLGYEQQNLPVVQESAQKFMLVVFALARSVGFDIGQYLESLASNLGIESSGQPGGLCRYGIEGSLLRAVNVKSAQYYGHLAGEVDSLEVMLCLPLFLSTLNFLNLVFRSLVVDTPDTFFKLKFVTLYHLASSLKKLQAYCYPRGFLSERSKKCLREILSDKDLRQIESRLRFRNTLVHYKLVDIPADKLNPYARLSGLVECCFEGLTFEELDCLLDAQIRKVSSALEDRLC